MYICHPLTQGHWWGKNFTPPLPYFSAFCVYLFGWIHLSLVHLFETNSWDPDLNKVGLMWGGSHKIKKDLQANAHKSLSLLVRPAGFEPATYGFVVRRSVHAELRTRIILIGIYSHNKLYIIMCQ